MLDDRKRTRTLEMGWENKATLIYIPRNEPMTPLSDLLLCTLPRRQASRTLRGADMEKHFQQINAYKDSTKCRDTVYLCFSRCLNAILEEYETLPERPSIQ